MRNRTLTSLACGFLAVFVLGATAHAESVRTTHTTKIYKQPGEQERVVVRVSAGHTMTVIAHQGRWLKVRVNGRTGWVTRTSVHGDAAARSVPRNTRRRPFVDGRSVRRGWDGDAPDDRVGADAVDDDRAAADDVGDDDPAPRRASRKSSRPSHARDRDRDRDDARADDDDRADRDDHGDADDEEAKPERRKMVTVVAEETDLLARPSRRSDAVLTVGKGDRLAWVRDSRDGEWMEVENDDGDAGWIRVKDVQREGRPAKLREVHARLGFASIGEAFASDGTGNLANYKLGSSAVAISLGGGLDYKYKKDYRIGLDLSYIGAKAAPGIRYTDGTSSVDIGFLTHNIDLRAKAGYDLHKSNGMTLWARLGYHYEMFKVDNVSDLTKNLAHLPSEILSGPTIGVAVEIPKLTRKIGGVVAADYLYPAKRTQTKGLEDGLTSKAKALWLGATFTYQWKPKLELDAGYRLSYAKTLWSGAAPDSMRGTGATTSERKDLTHTVTVGLAKSF